MKILITEKQFKRVKSELEEVVGVPQSIIQTAIKVFDSMVNKLKNYEGTLKSLERDKITLNGKFPIGDITIKTLNIDFQFFPLPKGAERDWLSATQRNVSKLLPNFIFKTANKKTEINMGLGLAMKPRDKVKDLVRYLTEKREELIPTFAHELQHSFFEKKSKYEVLKKRVSYQSLQELNFGRIEPINDFFFDSYFIHAIENIVRPTELATQMELKGITQKRFLDFFLETDLYKRLNKIRRFTYNGLRDELKIYITEIKNLLESIDIDTQNMSDSKLINEILRLALVNLTNTRGDLMKSILTTHPLENIFGFLGEKDLFFRKYINDLSKYGENYEGFFLNEEKKFKYVADQMIRKLSKLYSIAKKGEE